MNALLPSPEQVADWSFFLGLLAGVVLALAATWFGSEYGIDWIARLVTRRRATVVDFEERRRLNAIVAIRGGR